MSEELLKQILSKLDNMATKDDIARIEKKLDSMSKQVASSAEAITEISESQERHERILELLSLRSIDHEALIRKK